MVSTRDTNLPLVVVLLLFADSPKEVMHARESLALTTRRQARTLRGYMRLTSSHAAVDGAPYVQQHAGLGASQISVHNPVSLTVRHARTCVNCRFFFMCRLLHTVCYIVLLHGSTHVNPCLAGVLCGHYPFSDVLESQRYCTWPAPLCTVPRTTGLPLDQSCTIYIFGVQSVIK